MKNLLVILLLLFSPHENRNHELTIAITNIKEVHLGKKIYIGYWHNANSDFPEVEKVDFKEAETIETQNYKITKSLAVNTYAVSIYIDMNGNGKLDKNMLGIPKEPYCFSKNYKPRFSQPDFEDCSFKFTKDQTLELNLIY